MKKMLIINLDLNDKCCNGCHMVSWVAKTCEKCMNGTYHVPTCDALKGYAAWPSSFWYLKEAGYEIVRSKHCPLKEYKE